MELGKLITGPEQRDAIHVAVAPVVAGHMLRPGDHVGFMDDSQKVCASARTPIGVIDPFLTRNVGTGEQCWLFLYPNSVTGMRHEWSHPAFGQKPLPEVSKKESVDWLTEFGKAFDLSFDEIIDHLKDWQHHGSHYVCDGFDTPRRAFTDKHLMWQHFTNVTGIVPSDADDVPFTCSC